MLNEIDLSRVDLNLLVLFEAVMRERHVGHAAARLDLSPSAVSHGLGRLRRLLNDPLFLRTPRGVVPSARATELEPRIAAILSAVRGVVAAAEPFDPATSTRRFRIGTPDATLGVFGPALVGELSRAAPRIGLALLHVLPSFRSEPDAGAWDHVLAQLENRDLDIAVIPQLPAISLPARFDTRPVGADRLVAVTRPDHPYVRAPSLETYCDARHILMSQSGDPRGALDAALAVQGLTREVAVTVPNFMTALAIAASSDLIVGLPSSLVRALGDRFGVVSTPLPLAIEPTPVDAVVTRAARADAGVAWLLDALVSVIRMEPS